MTSEAKIERRNKILKGLEKAYEKMIDFKKERKSELVIIRDNKIINRKASQKKLRSFFIYDDLVLN